ncbi:tyrosine-protein phosphatase [Streptomyces sp. NBC_01767]|uniref:tyrosine-protein phosphatase n=1 Tax=unclassified Streptomyces TaxID=2593676 RepID=UPI002252B8C3|nr:tyrosine-protein phosphatase [Streptomyces sp. NBC_01767]MCX4399027.1 tyrosine-protein phosphatase [Streptomyces sp. NBC_01767]WSG48866.1 tyrosine-protein phosphatase [Streptomyces sp. NBC_01732]
MNRHLAFERLHNFRDVGGYPGEGGRPVRWGRLYRSDSLGKLRGEDEDRFRALGIGTVIDLRYDWEIAAKGRVPEAPGLRYHNLSIEHRPYDQAALGPEVETGRFLADRYAEVAHDGVVELRRALEVIADENSGPVVFHCASGKDRTGLLAALVLSLLGVAEDDIVADFALTGLATERLLADWRADHSGQDPRWPGYGTAPADIMRLFLADLTATHGSVHAYVTEFLGTDPELAAALRGKLLEPAG